MRIAALGAAVLLTAVPAVSAQTTLRSAKDATIRGGSYANTNYGSDPILETRQSDDPTYARRAAVMFDTDASFAATTSIASAQLVLTVKSGNAETRTLAACAMSISFDEPAVTWTRRNSSSYWQSAGGDIVASDCSYATVTATAGSRVTFDVTTQVRKAVAGTYGTRYARFLVQDSGGSSRDSYKQYYSNNTLDASVQPALIVATGSSSSMSSSSSSTASSSSSASNIVLWAGNGRIAGSAWQLVSDSSAAGGARLWNPDRGAGKLSYPASSPSSYVDFTFTPVAGVPYRLWFRGKADGNDYTNDSLYVQFSNSVTSGGSAQFRIGTTSGAVYSLESCSGAGESGWGWEDIEYCGNASPIHFASSSAQTLRIQQREDGISIDQIVLSPSTYLSSSPGSLKSDTKILARTTTTALATPSAPVSSSTGSTSTSGSSSGSTTTTSSTTLRVLQWNLHHGGYGTDGVYDPNRVATWMAKFNPDVILVNEIEKYTSWGNQDQPAVYKNLLQQKTGKTWYYIFAQEFGQWSSNGKGNAIFSTVPFSFSDRYELVHNYDRSIAEGSITWNGRSITLISTHLDPYDQSLRLTQATEVTTWASKEPENRIITGDMNAWPDQTSIAQYDKYYYDSWAVAAANGTATAFSGNSGETKNGRIDYIFYSKTNTNLSVKSSQVYDTRDANGVMPSDHRPVLTTFYVK